MTDRKFTPATVSDFRVGDIVRITKGDAVIVAPVRHERHYGLYADIPGLNIASDSIELDELAKADGVTLERAEPTLVSGFYVSSHFPVRPGGAYVPYYIDRDGDLFEVRTTGAPVRLGPVAISSLRRSLRPIDTREESAK